MKVLAEEGTNRMIEEIKKLKGNTLSESASMFVEFYNKLNDLRDLINRESYVDIKDSWFLQTIKQAIIRKHLFFQNSGFNAYHDQLLEAANKWQVAYTHQDETTQASYLEFIDSILTYINSIVLITTAGGPSLNQMYEYLPNIAFVYDFLTPQTTN